MLVAYMLCSQLTPAVYAQSAPEGGSGGSGSGGPGPNELNLDLSSTERTIAAPEIGSPVNITSGGNAYAITTGQLLTPAELVALNQVLAGNQTIQLALTGNAIGGTVSLNGTSSSLANIVIPVGVTALHDFGSANALNISGNLSNAGTFYAFSSASGIQGGTINALNIFNQQGALLTSVLPSSGLTGITSAVSNFNLTLNAIQNIINAGTISSSGSLTATAGGSIQNILPATGPSALMQAMNNISLQAANILNQGTMTSQAGALNLAAANIVNSGLMQSVTSNINITSLLSSSQDLSILNNSGVIQALAGDLNLRTPALSEIGDLTVSGGDIAAESVNAFGRKVNIHVHDLVGRVNITGSEAHVSASTDTLTLGDINLSGDPTFFNRLGDVLIGGNLIFGGQALAVVASRDIISNGGGPAILTSSAVANGGEITFVAGVDFTSTGPNSGSGDTTSKLVLDKGSGTGGKIALNTANPISQLDSSSSKLNGSAGNITMVAFKGSNADSGTISLPSSVEVRAQGNGTGSNGSVTMIAGATSGTAINIGAVRNNGGAAGTGDIILRAATPTISAGASILNGVLTGSFDSSTSQQADIRTNQLAAGNDIAVTTAGNIQFNEHLFSNSGGSISAVAGGNITAHGFELHIDTHNNSGDAGSLLFAAGAAFTQTGNKVTITGASGTGGSFEGNTVHRIQTYASGKGGNVSMVAFEGSNAGSGQISLQPVYSTYTIDTGGDTASGDVAIMAGNSKGAELYIGGVWTEGGPSSTGGKVTITASTPDVGTGVTFDLSTASLESGTLSAGALQNSDLRLQGHVVSNGTAVTLVTPKNIFLGSGFGQGHLGNYHHQRGGVLTFVAGESIINSSQEVSIRTSNSSGNAGGILMAAGAAFNRSGDSLTITGASATGGSIQFGSVHRFDSWGEKGGDVTLLAFKGSTGGTGQINMPSTYGYYIIDTGGNTVSGNVTVLAGATNGAPLVTGGLWTEGALSSTGGAILYGANTPVVGAGVTFDVTSGQLTAGAITAGAFQNSDLQIAGHLIGNGLSFSLITPGNIMLTGGWGQGHLGTYYVEKGGSITLVAGKNITNTAQEIQISTSNSTGAGGGVTMIAGANFVKTGNTLTVTGGSATGGSISMGSVHRFRTHGTTGGDVHLLAFSGSAADSGRVSLPPTYDHYDIDTGGNTRSGNITVLAGATDGTALHVGGVRSEGGQGSTGGAILIRAANPTVGGGVNFDLSTGVQTAGILGFGPLRNSDVNLQGNFIFNGINTSVVSLQDILLGGGSQGNGHIGSYYNRRGGSLSFVAGGDITNGSGEVEIRTDNPSGNGGAITFIAGANFSEAGNLVTIHGGSVTGGSISVDKVFHVDSSGGNNGGNITLLAFSGSTASSGRIQLPSHYDNYIIYTDGVNGTNSGNFTAMAGATDGSPLILGGVYTEGGPAAGGGAITITPSTPVVGAGITIDRNTGSIVAGTLSAGTLQNSDITLKGDVIHNGQGVSLVSLANINLGAGVGAGDIGNWNFQKGGSITLVAGRNIVNTGDQLLIRTSTGGNAGHIRMIAGAAFNQVGNTLTIAGASASGGSVLFTGGVDDFLAIGGNKGGDIMIMSFAGGDIGSGRINIDSHFEGFNMHTDGGSVSGSVTILAGATDGAPLISGGAWTEGSYASTGGKILVSTSSPDVGAGVDINLGTGAVSSGTVTAGAMQNSDIILRGSVIGNGVTSGVTLITPGNITLGATASEFGSLGNWHHLKSTPVLVVAGGNITGLGTSNIYIASGSDNATSAAQMTLVAGASFSLAGNTLTINGASATGGSIVFADIDGFYASNKGSVAGNAGDITLAAFAGGNAGSGRIDLPGNYTIQAFGAKTGANGDVSIFVGANSGVVQIPNINTTGGTGGRGNVLLQATQPNSPVDVSMVNATITSGTFAGGAPGGAKLGVANVTAAGTVTSSGILNTPGGSGNGFAVNITAGGAVFLEEVVTDASSSGTGGAITISSGATIQATGSITSKSAGTNASGAISITATGAIQLQDIDTTGDTGGQVGITSSSASVTLAGDIVTRGVGGKAGGSVTINAATTVTLPNIDTAGKNAGSIAITSGGKISVNNILATGIATGGGGADINLLSTTNDIIITGLVDSRSNVEGDAGKIALNAGRNLVATVITASGENFGRGATVTINAGTSTLGSITSNSIFSNSSKNGAGNITLGASGTITVNGDINSECDNNIVGKLITIQGGQITITSGNGLTVTGEITSSSLSGAGGTLRITNTTSGAINIAKIDTQSTGEQLGGISTGFLNPVSGEVYITQQAVGEDVVD
jgi:hypothetical protein